MAAGACGALCRAAAALTRRAQAEFAKKKAIPATKDVNKDHLGPVIMCELGAKVAVVLTTPTRIRLLCALTRVDRCVATGLQLDATGGIVREGGEEVRARARTRFQGADCVFRSTCTSLWCTSCRLRRAAGASSRPCSSPTRGPSR